MSQLLILHNGTSETVVLSERMEPTSQSHQHLIANGWLAYIDEQKNLWRVSPMCEKTFGGTSNGLLSLSADGEVASASASGGISVLNAAGGSYKVHSESVDKVNGVWYALSGKNLLKMTVPTAAAENGALAAPPARPWTAPSHRRRPPTRWATLRPCRPQATSRPRAASFGRSAGSSTRTVTM